MELVLPVPLANTFLVCGTNMFVQMPKGFDAELFI
jgi:hypothetical protein